MRLGELREGLGRLQFLAGPLEHLRPFLGPLYAWSCAGPRYARPRMPVMILLILRFLAAELGRRRMSRCASKARDLGELFRLDAKTEGEEAAIGGWRCRGSTRTAEAEWFAVRLNRRNAPWAFARGEPFRAIAALELLASLIGLMVLVPECEAAGETSAILTLSCGTDNQGNSYLLDRMLTTKYPLGVVLMELAHQMRLRRLILRAKWLPRLQNEEADALTNLDFRHFDKNKRIHVDLQKLKFGVLNELFEAGETYMAELEEARSKAKLANDKLKHEKAGGGNKKQRRKAGDSLRERDPW